MTLVLKQLDHDDLCHGWEWEVDDIDLLAERVARVALGQYRHVGQILEGLAGAAPAGTAQHAADALKKLKLAKNGDPWHRDGWLFQVISWIAANQTKQGAILAPPHIFHAHKGFDGMQLELSGDSKAITAIVIFEDKATENARQTITQNVWPDIVALEAGERVAELTCNRRGRTSRPTKTLLPKWRALSSPSPLDFSAYCKPGPVRIVTITRCNRFSMIRVTFRPVVGRTVVGI
jgi:hypothetical protein